MKNIVNLLFEAKMLKEIPRSGYHFLGAGKESVAEHCFITTFIAYVMAELESNVDARKLISMCLVHDLSEARIGDLNSVHKTYLRPNEEAALRDTTADLPFGSSLAELMREFNDGNSKEAKLARDADQLALMLELKGLSDLGYVPPNQWLTNVIKRVQTKTGKKMADAIMNTSQDEWWRNAIAE